MINLNNPVKSIYYLPSVILKDLDSAGVTAVEIISLIRNKDNLGLALELMDECEELTKTDGNLNNILHHAASKFLERPELATKIIKKWISKGLPVNGVSKDGYTFFHYLVEAYTTPEAGLHLDELLQLVVWMLNENVAIDLLQLNNHHLSAIDLLLKNPFIPINVRISVIDLFLEFIPEVDQANCLKDILLLPFVDEHGKFFKPDDITAMVSHYSYLVDMDYVFDAARTPLLLQPFYKKGYTPAVSIKIAKAMIECGADPNVTDQRGETLLMHVIDLLPLCEEGVSQFIAYLLEHGADPSIVNRCRLGCVYRILYSLDFALTREKQSSLLKLIYRKDIATELLLRQLLVNLFDISEYKTNIYNEEFGLEGARSLEKFYTNELLITENEKFYDDLVVRKSTWRKVVSRLSDSSKNKVCELSRARMCHIMGNLQRVPNILKLCSDTEKMDSGKYFQAFGSDDPFALVVSHRVGEENKSCHAVGYYNHWNYILVSNRGHASGNYFGVTIHRKSDISDIDRLCIDLFNGLEVKTFMRRHFNDRMVSPEPHYLSNIVYHLPDTCQVGGNCPISSYESLELSVLFMLIDDVMNDQDFSAELARGIRDVHLSSRRKMVFSRYLELHENPDRETVPVDYNLLKVLATHKISDDEEDQERYKKIASWVARKYLFLQLRYGDSALSGSKIFQSREFRYPQASL